MDVTECKHAEKALRQSEERLRLILENSTDGINIAELDPETPRRRLIMCNDKYVEMSGRSREELMASEDLNAIMKPYGTDQQIQQGRQKLSQGIAIRGTSSWIRPDGKENYYEWTATPIPMGDRLYIVGIDRDITERKKAEEKLKQYQFMVESAHDAIFFKDLENRYVIANKKTLEAFGLSREQVIGKSDVEIMPNKEQAKNNIEDDRTVFKTGKVVETTKQMSSADGKRLWFEAIKVPQFNDEGNIIGLVGIARDVTERRAAEDELLFKTALLEAQSETSIDGILVVDNEGKSILFNERFGKMWNIPEHILGTQDDEKMLQYVLEQVKEPGKFLEKVKYLYSHKNEKSKDELQFKDGRVFDRYSCPLVDPSGRYYGRIWYFRNITESKRAEEELRRSREEYVAVTNLTGDIIVKIDKEGRWTFLNDGACNFWGRPREELLGTLFANYLHPNDIEKTNTAIEKMVKSKQIISMANRQKSAKRWRTVEWNGIAIFDEAGNYLGLQATGRDITEHKMAKEALQRARDELETRVEQRTAELAEANKELRSEIRERQKAQKRLRSLTSELSLAEERLRRRIATEIHDYVGQNLAISKMKLESLSELVHSPELVETLEDVRNLVAQTIQSMRSLTFELSPPVLYELGFEAAVEWLVRQIRQQHNLSADFSDDGQSKPLDDNVRVLLFQAVRELLVNVAKHAKAQNVTVLTQRIGNEIQVSVEDNGVGFDIPKRSTHDYKTNGFGLFSIRERLSHIGGRLDVKSRPGCGTRVTLEAPIGQARQNRKEKTKWRI